MEPFEITIKTNDDKYIEGGAKEQATLSGKGYFLCVNDGEHTIGNCQGALDIRNVVRTLINVNPEMVKAAFVKELQDGATDKLLRVLAVLKATEEE